MEQDRYISGFIINSSETNRKVLPNLIELSDGTPVEVDQDFIRFHDGPFFGKRKWFEYTEEVELRLPSIDQDKILESWIKSLKTPNQKPLF